MSFSDVSKRSKMREDGWNTDVSVSKQGAGKPLKEVPLAKGKKVKTLKVNAGWKKEKDPVPKGCTMDKEDLIDNILKLRANIAAKKKDSEQLRAQIKVAEARNEQLSKERRFRETDVDIHRFKDILEEEDKSYDDMTLAERKIDDANLELELRILIDNMKANIPLLEKKALRMEKLSNEQEKCGPTELQKAYYDMPEIYRMKPEERQKELERMSDRQNELDREVEEKRAKLKVDRAKRKDEQRKKREEFNSIVENNANMQLEISKYERMIAAEIVTDDMLKRELSDIRAKICHEDFTSPRHSSSWYRRAFIMHVGNEKGLMDIDQVAQSAKIWVADDTEMLDGIEERIVYAISEIKRLKKDGIFGSEEKDSGVVLITVEEYINILLIALECYK